MGSPQPVLSSVTSSNPSSNDENPRIKLLCSFSGSIMPRPQDGKLRYVGGETRIVCLSRDIKYANLMTRMRELYEGAYLLKYQQPDEDLDALVSVVNDDDVMNMMEEYEKLGSKDGFTRLRVFLFSHPEQESSPRFVDSGFERDSERRYVDALNSINDASDIRQLQKAESCGMNVLDDSHFAEQFYNQRNFEMLIPQMNLRELTIPRMESGAQNPQSITQRYNDVEAPAPWSPAYYSPGHQGVHDTRPFNESPSSARHYVPPPLGEFSDNLSEEYGRHQMNQKFQYDQSPHFSENVMSGFPGNLYHGSNIFEQNSICGHCRMNFQRSPPSYPNPLFNSGEQQHVEQSTISNNGSCAECLLNRETYLLNRDPNSHHGIYPKEQTDPRSFCNESHSHERGLFFQHHLNHTGMSFSHGHGNIPDARHPTSNYVHDDPRLVRAASHELGIFHDQFVPSVPHVSIPVNEHGVRYGNSPYTYGIDNSYQASHGHVPVHPLRKNVQNPIHSASYEPSNQVKQANYLASQGFVKGFAEGSPRFCHPRENVNTLIESPPNGMAIDGSGYAFDRPSSNMNYCVSNQGIIQQSSQERRMSKPVLENIATPIETSTFLNPSTLTSDRFVTSSIPDEKSECKYDADATEAAKREYKIYPEDEMVKKKRESLGGVHIPNIHSSVNDKIDNIFGEGGPECVNVNCLRRPKVCLGMEEFCASDIPILSGGSNISMLPQLLDSKKKAALECVEEMKGCKIHEQMDADPLLVSKETAPEELENVIEESRLDSETDNHNISAIEPTKAEEEAIARGLQTIKNEDLEEIRELGTGTYGAVYHGKWKGSDVAIKKIKASCFAGRPSERERLIADFWKEALILSSLHHPNVVSFYGIVRDRADGSLVTVTEFMVNGSLKQFIKKKDRTIDRRKRLIIAMDAAFGMEYLHGKNIVHFDLKCENLLVNMRDPHRPVCKIGDLGLSKVKQHTLVSGGVRGTLPWMAPELLSGKSNMVTEKIDVYSFGIVMWELLTGEEPYADMHSGSIIGGIVNNQIRPQIPTWCDPEWRALMEACWGSDPSTRPSFTQISQKLRNMSAAINAK